MDKMDFAWELSEEAKSYKDKVYALLMKDAHVKKWLKQHDLGEEFVYAHTGKFSSWLEQIKRCDHCAGLSYCTQKIKGCYMDLYVDGRLDFTLCRCHYAKERERALTHRNKYVESHISEEQLMIDLTRLDITKESAAYKTSLAHIAALLQQERAQKGLYLWGKPGVGKSYLAAGIANHYAKLNKSVAFVNVPKLISELKLLFREHEAMERKLKRMGAADVLVLDDIASESITAWSRDEVLLPLLDQRMEQHRLTFFSGNYSMDECKERYVTTGNQMSEPMAAERIADRIRALANAEFIKGNSRRK